MNNLVVALIIIAIIGGSITYVVNQKRKGVKCIGCPHGGSSKKKPTQIKLSNNSSDCGCNDNNK